MLCTPAYARRVVKLVDSWCVHVGCDMRLSSGGGARSEDLRESSPV